MLSNLRPAVTLLLALTLLTGIAYPLVMTGAAQALFPAQANGSLVDVGGKTIGSELIGQKFETDRYFHGRPSAVDYDASTSSGSNYGPSSKPLLDAIKERAAVYGGSNVPADLVTASGSGLDPDISPAAALIQVSRVAAARGLPEDQLRSLVTGHVQGPDLGILGAERVNVLALNLALDTLKP
ncbi:potassium-transporting ATPase subunit KdpC [Devosia sp.]|uniref:potassium-transporting ATPase subunit KdpC n=1 Tax=Devosia sp. TaxID=1871048 RepID=UPI003BA9701B